MLRFLFCLLYLAVLGLLCFPFGRLLARRTYDPARWPFRMRRFEMDGKFYESIKIKTWENQVPDVSRWAPEIVPVKRVTGRMTAEMCAGMINETCVAEITHAALCVLGLALLWIWPGWGGAAVFLVDVLLGNVPFILIQRYQRQRLLHVQARLLRRETAKTKGKREGNEGSDPELQ